MRNTDRPDNALLDICIYLHAFAYAAHWLLRNRTRMSERQTGAGTTVAGQ